MLALAALVGWVPKHRVVDELVYLTIGVFCLAASLLPLRYAFAAFFVFVGIAGVLKDLSNYATLVHLSNDLVMASLLAGYALGRLRQRLPLIPAQLPLKVPVGILVVAAAVLTFMPITTPIQALGGWKAYVGPAILIVPAAVAFQRTEHMRPSLLALIVVGLANALAALYEFRLGPLIVGTWGPGFQHTVTGAVTFFDLGGFHGTWKPFGLAQDNGACAMLEAVATVLLIQIAAVGPGLWRRLLALPLIPLLMVALLVSGVRAAMVAAAAAGIFALLMALRRPVAIPIAIAIGFVGWTLFGIVGNLTPALHFRLASLLNTDTFLSSRGQLLGYIVNVARQSPLGVGLGKTVPSADLLGRLAGAKPQAFANENVLLDMLLEMGWFGAAAVLTLAFEMLIGFFAFFRARLQPDAAAPAFLLCFFLAVIAVAGPLLAAQPGNVLLWVFSTGALLAVRRAHAAPVVEHRPRPRSAASPEPT